MPSERPAHCARGAAAYNLSMRLCRLAIAACFLAAPAAHAAWEWTLSDDLTLGKDRYTSNTVDLAVAPSRAFGGDVSYGVNSTATPAEDSSRSGGFGLWVAPGERATFSLNGSRYEGARGEVYDRLGNYVAETADRQETGTLSGTFSYRLIAPGNPDDPPSFWLTGSLGVFGGGHRVPVWTRSPDGSDTNWGKFRIGDRGPSAGLSAGRGGTSGGVSFRSHTYTFTKPPDSPPLVFLALLRTSVSSALYGLPLKETTVSLAQRFLGALTADASVTSETLATNLEVVVLRNRFGRPMGITISPVSDSKATTVAATLSWDAAAWMSLRAGGFASRQRSPAGTTTSTYGTAGVSLFF